MAEKNDNEGELFSYLEGKPESFKSTADVILVLDCGEELPVHSSILSAHSEPLSDMLLSTRPIKRARTDSLSSVIKVPFPNCSSTDADVFLRHMYSLDTAKTLSMENAKCVVPLAHKFAVKPALCQYDLFMQTTNGLWVRDLHQSTN